MLKFIETALETKIARIIQFHGRKFGSHKGLSPIKNLTEVNALINNGLDKLSPFDLSKRYENVNRKMIWKDCRNRIKANGLNMLPACLQELTITTKADMTVTKTFQRLILRKGAPLSPILFLIYIDDIVKYFHRSVPEDVKPR